MKRGLVLIWLAAAIACSSSAGDMMGEALDDMTDIPDAGAQSTECLCEAGAQGEPGEQGSQGDPGHSVVFCADFGAFCGFSPETFSSMGDCSEAILQLGDDGIVCTTRNLHAARSGDTGGCGAIANLDPCSFSPGEPKAAPVTLAVSKPVADLKTESVGVPVCNTVSIGQISEGQTVYVDFDALHRAFVSSVGTEHQSNVNIDLVEAGGSTLPVRTNVLIKANGASYFSVSGVVNDLASGNYDLKLCYTTSNTPHPELINGVATVLVLTES